MSVTEVKDLVTNAAERIEFERSWADIPDLVLFNIFSQISMLRHKVMFSRVCKSWNLIQSQTPVKQQFQLSALECPYPHLFFTRNKLIHPTLEKVFELERFPNTIRDGIQLRNTKKDWMLFTQNPCMDPESRISYVCKAFFFNPFTRAVVWLPDLISYDLNYSMCFTSTPTSTNFKVVLVRSADDHEKIVIDTFKYGKNKWTSCEFEFGENSVFEFSYVNPVLYNGMCYVLDKYSRLLIHDPKDKTFSLHEAPKFLCGNVLEQYMLESEGKLLAVFVETSGNWVLVCWWNVSNRKWENLKSIENKVLFVSRPYSLSVTVGESEMGNRIYFPRLVGDRCLFYSLCTKKFHSVDGSSHNGFLGSKSAFSSTWIKPSRVMKNS